MTDAELRDAAVSHLKLTTVGFVNKHWKTPPAGSEWAQALDLLSQISKAAPLPPPPSGTALAHISDLKAAFEPAFTSPAVAKSPQLTEIVTPSGPGFRVVAGPTDVTPWQTNAKAILGKLAPESAFRLERYHFNFMLPSSGNPAGFIDSSFAGVLWEYHTHADSGHHLAIDGRLSAGGPRFDFRLYVPPWTTTYQHFYVPGKVQLDHWYSCDLETQWAPDASGHLKFSVDGQQVVDYSGPTIKVGEERWLQFGFYSLVCPTNEVQFGGVSRS